MAEPTTPAFINVITGERMTVADAIPSGSITTDMIANDAVTTTKIDDDAVTTAKIANDAVTYAKIQNISAQFRALGRNSASAGDTEEVTLTQLLDWIGSAAQGDILYRGSSSWARLAAGTNGQFLQTQGAGANPQWATVSQIVTAIDEGAVAASTTNVDIALGSSDMVEIELFAVEPSNDGALINMVFSQDNGSSYLTGASDYAWGLLTSGGAVNDSADSRILVNNIGIGNAAGETGLVKIRIYRPAASSFFKQVIYEFGSTSTAGLYFNGNGWGRLVANTDPITNARFSLSAGTFDAGYFSARGYSFT
jgi:hypothetical protein